MMSYKCLRNLMKCIKMLSIFKTVILKQLLILLRISTTRIKHKFPLNCIKDWLSWAMMNLKSGIILLSVLTPIINFQSSITVLIEP